MSPTLVLIALDADDPAVCFGAVAFHVEVPFLGRAGLAEALRVLGDESTFRLALTECPKPLLAEGTLH